MYENDKSQHNTPKTNVIFFATIFPTGSGQGLEPGHSHKNLML